MIGIQLAHFRIAAKLGEGGMGEVYLAEDTKLGREVAIKVLPEAFVADPERLARFEREARVLASLNHPSIAGVYEVGVAECPAEEGGVPATSLEPGAPSGRPSEVHFLVMELATGETLADRIARGRVPLGEAIRIALQIAAALEAAHAVGIVHRDLKPANVKVTRSGDVKVLDFGLAKAMSAGAGPGDGQALLTQSPTLTAQMTGAGVILGTAAYMSPEQARGEEADRRSDIWSFGVVLAEMLTGSRAFLEPTVSDTLAAVLKSEPNLSALPADLPPGIRRILDRCLRKDPKERLRDIGDVALELREAMSRPREDVRPSPVGSSHSRTALAVAAVAGALVGGIGVGLIGGTGKTEPDGVPPSTPIVRFAIQPPAGASFVRGLAVSPDGTKLVFVARDENGQPSLWLRSLDDLESRRLPATEGAVYPFWSPDSTELGFFSQRRLKIVDLIGSPPRELLDTDFRSDVRGGTWSPNGTIIYAPTFRGGLWRVPAAGGEPEPATEIDTGSGIGTHRFPFFLPDGEHFVFYAARGTGMEPGELRLGVLGSTATKRLTDSSSQPVWLPPDHLVYARGEVLVAHELDLDEGSLVGQPLPLGVDLPGGLSASGSRSLSAATSGTLVYRVEDFTSTTLSWVDREGNEIGTIGEDRTWHYGPSLSPDGSTLAVARYAADTEGGDLWLYHRTRGIGSRYSSGPGDEDQPFWSPDGKELMYSVTETEQVSVVVQGVDAPASQRRTIVAEDGVGAGRLVYPSDWTVDGDLLVEVQSDEKGWDIFRVEENGDLEVVVQTPHQESSGRVSPDGRWLAYNSDASGQIEVFVQPYPEGGVPWRVSTAGGITPIWSRDGSEIFFVAPNGWLMTAAVVPGDEFSTENPEGLFHARLEDQQDNQYDVGPDGIFILNRYGDTGGEPITVVTNLSATLDR